MKRVNIFLLLALPALAQEFSFDVTPKKVGINETVRFIIQIENPSGRAEPSFPQGFDSGDFALLQRSPTRSLQQQYINGVGSSTVTYTYLLRPQKLGNLVFPPQQVELGGKTFRTVPVTIEVGEESRAVPRQDPFRNDPFSRRRDRDAELFVTAETPQRTYYQGESIPCEIKIWRTPGLDILNQGSSVELPEFRDFWAEDVDRPAMRDHMEVREGQRYQVTPFAEKRLFATKAGDLTIEPAEFNLTVRTGFFDRQQVSRATDPVALTIKPLPSANRPAGFSGAVGKFEASGSLDRDTVKVGETVSLTLEVTGDGYFAALGDPKLEGLSRDFELFEGGAPESTKRNGITFSKKWIYALVPKRAGSYSIELPRISYFDPVLERYKSTGQQTFTFEVLPGQTLISSGPSADSNELQRNRNLAFIKLGELGLLDARQRLKPPRLIVVVLAGFIAFDLLVFLVLQWRNRSLSRRRDLRPKFAWRNFQKAQSRLRGVAGDPDRFYAGLSQAVFDYFGDKWERAGQGISLEMIYDRFDRGGIDASHYEKVAECIEACDLARFTPSTPSSRENLLEKAGATLGEIEGALS